MLPLPRGLFGTVVVVRNKIVSVIAEKTQPGSQIARKLKNFGSAEDVALGKCVLLFLFLFSFNFQVREPGLYQVTCDVVFNANLHEEVFSDLNVHNQEWLYN